MNKDVAAGTLCPACGYDLGHPAWHDELHASFEICPSCGLQFGYQDSQYSYAERREIHARWRQDWIERGMPWHDASETTPPDWDPARQLKRLRNLQN